VLNHSNKTIAPKFKIKLSKGNVHQILQAVKLWVALTQAGTGFVEVIDTGMTIFQFHTKLLAKGLPIPPPWIIPFFTDLDFIQKTTKVEIFPLVGKIDSETLGYVYNLAQNLRLGYCDLNEDGFSQKFSRAQLEDLLARPDNNVPKPLTIYGRDQVENILGTKVSLGPFVAYYSDIYISKNLLEELKLKLKSSDILEFEIAFEPVKNSVCKLFLLDRLLPDTELPTEVKRIIEQAKIEPAH